MAGFPGSVRTLAGALVAFEPLAPLSRIVVFQYNPDELTRSLAPRQPAAGGSPSDARRVWGAPTETIAMTLELDATDGLLTDRDPIATAVGVSARLAALEMLLHPATATVAVNAALLQAGSIEIVPPLGPLTVLVWGGRIAPVRLTGLTVREQAFDGRLVPVQATVDVSLDVLSYDDLEPWSPGFTMYFAGQVAREALAVLGAVQGTMAAASAPGGGQ